MFLPVILPTSFGFQDLKDGGCEEKLWLNQLLLCWIVAYLLIPFQRVMQPDELSPLLDPHGGEEERTRRDEPVCCKKI